MSVLTFALKALSRLFQEGVGVHGLWFGPDMRLTLAGAEMVGPCSWKPWPCCLSAVAGL